ncbi:anti-repressor SinI family protein [Paenibacillus chartarius]|uniref:Anti-repressor SinI family protein n=1 Tax=Paenibacillus chartarius TaxID=747481 RepID=A0ABV6DUZ0_9BACL
MSAMLKSNAETGVLDADWIELIREARRMGLTVSEVRAYFKATLTKVVATSENDINGHVMA